MSNYNKKDMMLLGEAYDLRLLKENAPNMTLSQVQARIEFMTESEAEYINTVHERILNEFWGGLKALGGAAKQAGQAVGGKLAQKGQAVAQKVGQAGSAVAQKASQVGQGAVAGAKQLASNAQDIYQTGNDSAKSGDAIKKAQTSAQQLIDLVTQAQQMGLVQAQGAVSDMTLAQIIDELTTAQQSAGTFKQGALDKGFTGGVAQAAKKGFQGQA
jgi:hypothetical protein